MLSVELAGAYGIAEKLFLASAIQQLFCQRIRTDKVEQGGMGVSVVLTRSSRVGVRKQADWKIQLFLRGLAILTDHPYATDEKPPADQGGRRGVTINFCRIEWVS
ncbi:MAG: hypothetical protein FWF05_09585 [Oscillospiraceae bacterium]|nr:hypothetical protein [Oscillospiraceae bacterium]